MDSSTIHVINDEEKVISLSGLFLYLLKRWKSIIIIAFIGLFIGLGLSFLPENIKYEKKNVSENKVEVFHSYTNILNRTLKEQEEDIIVNFNPEETCSGSVNYYIEGNKEEIQVICNLFRTIYSDTNFWNDLNEIYDNKYTTKDLRKLFGVNSSIEALGSEVSINNLENIHNIPINAKIYASFTADNYENCQKMMSVFDKYYKQMESNLPVKSYKFKSKIEEIKLNDSIVKGRKDSFLSEREGKISKVAALREDLTDDEVNYVKKYYPEDVNYIFKPNHITKPILIAFVFGFLICFIYALKYIFNNQLKSAKEVNENYGIHILGLLRTTPIKKGIDGKIQKLEDKKDLTINTEDYIINSLKNIKETPFVFIGNKKENDINNIMNNISNKYGIIESYGQLQSDPLSISNAAKSKGAILIIKLWNSGIEEINREIQIALSQNINIIGAIVIK